MTKFCEDAVSHRDSRGSGLTGKDLKKNMQKFLETGVHPDVEAQRKRAEESSGINVPLPSHDANRDFIFFDMVQGRSREPLGRVVIELYNDIIPVGTNHLRNRVLPGSVAGLQGAEVHKLQPGYAMWLGKNPKASEGMCMQINPRLKHVDEGAVSISLNGDEVVIALGRAVPLNSTHQVVGSVHKGHEVLKLMSGQQTNHFDAPVQKILVSRCGLTNAQGIHEDLDEALEAERAAAMKKDPAAVLKEASTGARQSVMDALQDALLKQQGQPQKRSASQAETADKSKRNVKGKYMDAMLGDLSGSGSSSGDEQ